MCRCNMGYELQNDLVPPDRCHSDGHPDSCKDCPNYKEYVSIPRGSYVSKEMSDKLIKLSNDILKCLYVKDGGIND